MECDMAVELFKRSKMLHNVFYGNYIGDEDSKTYSSIDDSEPYVTQFLITKMECVLHVAKRMYRRLIDAKKSQKKA